MKYANVKSGLQKLLIAELLSIAAGLSVSMNGDAARIISIVQGALGVAAFGINLLGIKQCAQDDENYKLAFYWSVAGLAVCFVLTVLGAILKNSALIKYVNDIQGIFIFAVAYIILSTTAPILRNCGKEAEAVYADKVKKLYTFAFVISEVFGIIADVLTGRILLLILAVLAAFVAVIALLVAQIRYIIFLDKSSSAL